MLISDLKLELHPRVCRFTKAYVSLVSAQCVKMSKLTFIGTFNQLVNSLEIMNAIVKIITSSINKYSMNVSPN